MADCATCDRPVPDVVRVCTGCERRLVGWLRGVPDLLDDLEITITRQDKFSANRVGGRSSETPLPFNERASDCRRTLLSTLNRWANAYGRRYADDAAVHLIQHAHVWRLSDDVRAMIREIDSVTRMARRAIDRPADRVFAGPCNTEVHAWGSVAYCTADLYARPGRTTVVCRECQAEHDVQARREWMLSEVRHYDADAGLMSTILQGLGFTLTSSTIRRYGAMGLIQVRGYGPNQVARYRIGDVLDVAVTKRRRKVSVKTPV